VPGSAIMLGPVGMLTQAVSEVSTSNGRNNFRDNFPQRTLSETRNLLNMNWIMTVPFIDQVGALPAASLQDNF
jgi:hypothetical protein